MATITRDARNEPVTGVSIGGPQSRQQKNTTKKMYTPSTARPASNQVRFKQTGDQVGNPLNNYSQISFPKVSDPDPVADRTRGAGSSGPNPLKRYAK